MHVDEQRRGGAILGPVADALQVDPSMAARKAVNFAERAGFGIGHMDPLVQHRPFHLYLNRFRSPFHTTAPLSLGQFDAELDAPPHDTDFVRNAADRFSLELVSESRPVSQLRRRHFFLTRGWYRSIIAEQE